MASEDEFLFQVGVDISRAGADLQKFIKDATTALTSIGKATISFDATKATAGLQAFTNAATSADAKRKASSLAATLGITNDELALMRTRTRIAGQAQALSDRYYGEVASKARQTADAEARAAQSVLSAKQAATKAEVALANQKMRAEANAAREAAREQARAAAANKRAQQAAIVQANRDARRSGGNGNEDELGRRGQSALSGLETGTNKSIGAFGQLNRILGNAVFKLVEYEVVMKSFNSVVDEVRNSLGQASNTRFEQTLQHIYSPTIDTTQALSNAIVVARQWGSDIQDVQQVIGLWTKQTSQATDASGHLVSSQQSLAAATYLAAEAEKFHVASGIETMDVYRSSIALSSQLGLKLGDLPRYYDMISNAATRIAVPLKAMGKSQEEGIKDIFDATDKDAALLHSFGFNLAQIIAMNAAQVQSLGEKGKEAGNQLATMWAALGTQGKGAGEFEKIIGTANFGDPDKLMKSLSQSGDALEKAFVQKLLSVKAQSGETFKAMIANLKLVQQISKEIDGDKSKGKLDQLADQAIDTFQGAQARLQTAVQAFSIKLGTAILPGATKLFEFLTTSLLPGLEKTVPAFMGAAHAATSWGIALLAFEGIRKAQGLVGGFVGSLRTMAIEEDAARAAGFASRGEMVAQMETLARLKAVQDTYALAVEKSTIANNANAASLRASSVAAGSFIGPLAQGEKEAAALAVSQTAVARTGAVLPGMFRSIGLGIAGMAAEAAVAMAPVLALVGAISFASAALDSFNRKKNDEAEISKLTEDRKPFGQVLLDAAADPGKAWHDNITGRVGELRAGGAEARLDQLSAPLEKTNSALGRDLRMNDAAGQAIRERLAAGSGDSYGRTGSSVSALNRTEGGLDQYAKKATLSTEDRKALVAQLNAIDDRRLSDIRNIKGYNDNLPHHDARYDALMRALAAKQKPALSGSVAAGGNPAPMYQAGPTKDRGAEAPQDLYRHLASDTKGNYTSQQTAAQDRVRAGEAEVATQEKLAQLYGWNAQEIAAATKGYNDQRQAILEKTMVTQSEISALERVAAIGRQRVANDKPGSKARTSDATTLRETENAITKSKGALVDLQLEYQKTTAARDAFLHGDLQLTADLARYGKAYNLPTTIKGYSDLTTGLRQGVEGAVGSDQKESRATAAVSQENDVVYALKRFQASEAARHLAPEQMELLARAIQEASGAFVTFGNDATAAATQTAGFDKSIRDMTETASKSNLKSLQTILYGDDTSQGRDTLKTLMQIADGLKAVRDQQDSLNKTREGYGPDITADQLASVNAAQHQLDIEKQLLPLLAEEQARREAIKASFAYRESDKLFDQLDNRYADNEISRVFKLNQKGGQRNEGVNTLAELLKDSSSEWIKEANLSATNNKFTLGPQSQTDQLRTMYDKYVSDLKANVQAQITGVVDPFTANTKSLSDTMGIFAASTDKLVAAMGSKDSAAGPASSAAPGAVSSNFNAFDHPLTMLPTGEMSSYFGKEQGLQSNDLHNAVADINTTAGNSASMLTYLMDIAGGVGTSAQLAVSPTHQTGAGGITTGTGATSDVSSGLAAIGSTPFSLFGNNVNYGWDASGNPTQSGGVTLGGLMQGATEGNQIGDIVGGLMNNGNNDAGMGGVLGGLAGVITAANPIAGIALDVGGSLLGGLFGNHDQPSKMPDKYDTQNYGQGLANLVGTAGANGQSFYESAGLLQETGGTTGLAYIEEQLAQYGSANNAPQWLKPLFNQLVQTFGMSATGSGHLNSGTDIGQQDVTGAQGITSGFQSYTNINSLANAFFQAAASNQTPLAPIISTSVFGGGPGFGASIIGGAGIGSVYDMPGINSSEFQAMSANLTTGNGNKFSQSLTGATTYYGTPGVGTNTLNNATTQPLATQIGQAVAQAMLESHVTVLLDGKVVAQSVNATNAQFSNQQLQPQ